MKKWIALIMILLLALAAWVGTGPYRAWDGMRDAIERQDPVALSGHVDFPALRDNLKAQLVDEMVRKAGPGMRSNMLGGLALSLGAGVIDGIVDVMVTPGGIGAVMQGHQMWRSTQDSFSTERGVVTASTPRTEPLYRYESLSRFTATVADADGEPVTFVLQRQGLDWKLVDIRLPLGRVDPAHAPGTAGTTEDPLPENAITP